MGSDFAACLESEIKILGQKSWITDEKNVPRYDPDIYVVDFQIYFGSMPVEKVRKGMTDVSPFYVPYREPCPNIFDDAFGHPFPHSVYPISLFDSAHKIDRVFQETTFLEGPPVGLVIRSSPQ